MPAKKIFDEFKAGTLHSGSKNGPKVTSRKQAIAIALSYNDKKDKKEHKKNNSDRHAHLGMDGSVKVSHSQVCGTMKHGSY